MNETGKMPEGRAETLPVGDIVPSRDNVHAKERRNDETFRGLVESIRANGLIHRIVVRPDAGRFVIVDGHRRFEAVKAAGWTEVPVEVRDTDAATALAVTVAANVQRMENDPLLEADAIGKMLGAGMGIGEIAAAIGKSDGYVARRARLVTLARPWREFAKRIRCTTDMLEKIAAHELSLQERVAANAGLDEYEEDGGEACGWEEFDDAFRSEIRRLDEAAFDTSVCEKCASNTACHRFLFDWMETEEGNAPRCQDAACYAKMHNAAVDAELERLRVSGKPAKEVSSKWQVPEYWNAAEKKDRKHPQAYVYEADGLRHILWGIEKAPEVRAGSLLTPEERAAQRAEKKRLKTVRAAREKVRARWSSVCAGGPETVKKFLGSAYDELAAIRLDRSIRSSWVADEFLDDFARVVFESATEGMAKEERDEYEKELKERDRIEEEAENGEDSAE